MDRPKQVFARLELRSARERTVLVSSVVIALLLLALDQGTKLWVEHSFELHESRDLIDGWLALSYVRNTGAAWSILNDRTWLLLLIGFLAFSAILYFFHYLTERCAERYFAVFMVLSGIMGNSIDRLWRGAVVDFIDVHHYVVENGVRSYIWHYPVFNVADISICVGVGIFVLSCFTRRELKKTAPDDESVSETGSGVTKDSSGKLPQDEDN